MAKKQFPKGLKVIFGLFFLSLLSFIANKIYYEATGDFRLSNIQYEETVFQPKAFPTSSDPEKIALVKNILDQNFQFLGKGNQSYAFLSEDKKTVLKFFKFGHLKRNWAVTLLQDIPFFTKYFDEKHQAQEARFLKVFEGYHVAYTEDPENSALIYIHLNKTNFFNQSVLVKDKLGLTHAIDLDSTVFVIQEKVTPTRDVLTELFKNHNIEGVKTKFKQLFTLYLTQYKKGLYDRDHNLVYNTGFKGDMAIRLDVGKFRKEPLIKEFVVYKKDLEKIALIRLNRFVKTYFPEHKNEMYSWMEEELNTLFNEEISHE